MLRLYRFGNRLVKYADALALQEELASQRKAGTIPDTLLLLQHPAVYTIGKRGRQQDFLASRQEIEASGAEVFSVPRGGETTFHGPGQLVAYPIVSLRQLHCGPRKYVEKLEKVVIKVLAQHGVSGRGCVPGRTGIWVEDRKIAALGVRIENGVTTHGTALNVSTDLTYFRQIVPCGLPDKDVTSMGLELQEQVDLNAVTDDFADAFRTECGYAEMESHKPPI